jgi:3-oxosteroid 1-dehydrogenase
MSGQEFETDVVIVGSGAGAMVAALKAHDEGARVIVIEKTELFGGTSAMSGGVMWFPASPMIEPAGGSDSMEAARQYMNTVIDEPELTGRIDAYLEGIHELLPWLQENTHLELDPNPYYADMYPDLPGATWQWRAHEARPIDGKLLGEDIHVMRRQHPQTSLVGVIGWTADAAAVLQTRAKGWFKTASNMMTRYLFDFPWRFKSSRDSRLVLGGALVGALYRSMQERSIPIWRNTAGGKLIMEEGRVAGLEAQKDGQAIRIMASKGVILSSGGFEKNAEMRKEHLPGPTESLWTAGSPGNTGEMIEAAKAVGSDTRFMDEAWWGPTVRVPGEPQARMLIIEKNLPGSMMVNKAGQRFVNEGSSYTKVIRGMQGAHSKESPSVPAFFIFDADYRYKYPFGPMLPGQFHPDWVQMPSVRKWLKKANTLPELVAKLGVDPAGLVATAGKMNTFAVTGADEDFKRGDTAYDRMYGDQQVEPNPCLGPVARPPFYGVEVFPGDLGTKGGVQTNEQAQALDANGEVIPGLYAIGNCSASVMGRTYPASGSTLAPAMVFGYVAGEHACQAEGQG